MSERKLSWWLRSACRTGDVGTVRSLLAQGVNPSLKDGSGRTALHWASMRGHLEVVQLLSSVNAEMNVQDDFGWTPLHYACRNGHLEVIKQLNKDGANLEAADNDGWTPLHRACWGGHLKVVKQLNKDGANLEATDNYGWTPLHDACKWGHTEVVKYLLREGHCNPNATDNDGDTPLAVTPSWHPTVIRELIRHGAHAANIYKDYGKELPEGCPRKPTESAVKVFIVGKQGMGKSTLTTALKKEGGIMTYVMKRVRQVSGIQINTAGVIPHDIHSRTFGRAIIYDFAGHEEFYSGHDVMLRSSIAGSPAVFLLVANLSLSDEEFRQSILSWLAFLENQGVPEDPKPHIIIVGSHADEVTSADVQNKDGMVSSIVSSLAFSSFHFAGFVPIDCRYAESPSMTKLRKRMSESCTIFRHKTEITFTCHCFYVYLLNKFRDSLAIRVGEALSKVQESTEAESGVFSFIPDDYGNLCKLLQNLHERGNILLLRDVEKFENSWLILDQDAILSEVTGTVFAPNPEEFKQYKSFATSTGVVPFSKIQAVFPHLNPELIAEFLCHFEFCHEITDAEGKQLLQVAIAPPDTGDATASVCVQVTSIHSSSCEKFFFFPGLVKTDTPEEVWKPSNEYSYHSGWVLQSSHPDKFFTRRFLHVLILRLAFAFALATEADASSPQLPTIRRKCSIWKNGIHWGDRSGTEALVEVVEGSRRINVMVRCLTGNEVECIRLRSALLQRILSAKDELCSRVPTSESFLHPSDSASHSVNSITEVRYASCSEIAKAVTAGKGSVVDQSGRVMALEALLSFEPYACLGEDILRELFDDRNPNYQKVVSNEFLYRVADHVHQKKDTFIQLFNLPTTLLHDRMCHAAEGPTHKLVEVFKLWRERCEGSYQCLRTELDHFSAFAGRNPLIIAGCNTSSRVATTTVEASPSHTHQWSPEEVDQTTLDIKALFAVNSELVSVAPKWMDLGLSLGLDKLVMEPIKSNYPRDVDRCLTETLARWLQQVRTARSWRAITLALIVPSISEGDLAHRIAMSHGIGSPKESDMNYQDVNSEQLDISHLGKISDELFTIHQWLHLGLSLGLSYHRLTIIEADNPQDTHHCRTEMLTAWLNGVGGESSWRQLACALDSPLIQKTEIATMIASEHRV